VRFDGYDDEPPQETARADIEPFENNDGGSGWHGETANTGEDVAANVDLETYTRAAAAVREVVRPGRNDPFFLRSRRPLVFDQHHCYRMWSRSSAPLCRPGMSTTFCTRTTSRWVARCP
jgi:hypothetical protein